LVVYKEKWWAMINIQYLPTEYIYVYIYVHMCRNTLPPANMELNATFAPCVLSMSEIGDLWNIPFSLKLWRHACTGLLVLIRHKQSGD
jgi:hypothetical protein